MLNAPGSRVPRVMPILVAMGIGVLAGSAVGPETEFAGVHPARLFDFLGSAFLGLLKMLIVPLVMASVITGVAGLSASGSLRRLGLKTLGFYLVTTLIAILVALMLVNTVQPGLAQGVPVGERLALQANAADITARLEAHAAGGLSGALLAMLPVNLVEAAASTNVIGLVLFSLLFGILLRGVDDPFRSTVLNFWQGLFRVMLAMTGWVMRLAPLGVFGLTARAAAHSGLDAAAPLLTFAGTVLGGLAIYLFLVLPLLVAVTGRVKPWPLFPAMAPALLTAFSTASSSATLPVSLDCLRTRARVSDRVAGFVMPLGTSVNHAGSALYECAAALFIAQAYGVTLPLAAQVSIVVLALVTSMGIATIPAASLVGLTIVLAAVGLPAEAIGVLLVVDRPLDMARTAVNVFADAACAVIVARREGEADVLRASPV